ncbi:MAG: GNAT family N-acetyltransferase [Candidatus Cloacimonetes bacterium]|nr:GNAT family N-acetyltransferase [Candidatus Cloacimonadota bacterium]
MSKFSSVKASIEDLKSLRQEDLKYLIDQITIRKYQGWPDVTQSMAKAQLLYEIQSSNESCNCLLFYDKTELCGFVSVERLEWDSRYFKFGCYKIGHLLVDSFLSMSDQCELATEMVKKIMISFASEARFVFSDADSWNEYHNSALQRYGFRYILTWIDGFYFGKGYNVTLPKGHSASLFEPSDYKDINRFVVKSYFEGGRFFLDQNFSSLNPRGIYESLFENSITNGDEVYVYRVEGTPAGIFICKKPYTYTQLNDISVAPLRYLVIDPKYRGQGIASYLYKSFVNHFVKSNHLVLTGLEIHNIPSLNLHSKLEFNFNYTHNAYHAWL